MNFFWTQQRQDIKKLHKPFRREWHWSGGWNEEPAEHGDQAVGRVQAERVNGTQVCRFSLQCVTD